MSNRNLLTNSEKIDILKFLSESNRKIHEQRIKRELQILITTLSFYAAVIALKLKNMLYLNNCSKYFIVLAFIVLAIGAFIYIKTSGNSNKYNQKQAELSENELITLLKDVGINIKINTSHSSANRMLWQILFIISGCIISSIIIIS